MTTTRHEFFRDIGDIGCVWASVLKKQQFVLDWKTRKLPKVPVNYYVPNVERQDIGLPS
jgi:hypothetical protein